MLILTRRVDEKILIGNDIVIHVCSIAGNQVKIGIKAPKDIQIKRDNCIRDKDKNIIDYSKKD